MLTRLSFRPETFRTLRPDAITQADQLAVGRVVIGFSAYNDLEGVVNQHGSHLAVIEGPAFRVMGVVVQTPLLGPHMPCEELPAYTRQMAGGMLPAITQLPLRQKAIEGIDDSAASPAGISFGLLAVSEAPYARGSLEVGAGLFVNGAADEYTFGLGYAAIALDSDERLAGQLL